MMSTNRCPEFGMAQTAGVREYVITAFSSLCSRLGLNRGEADHLLALALDNLETCTAVLARNLTAGIVEPLPEARRFLDTMGEAMVDPSSTLIGLENLHKAFELTEHGANVLVVQNHRSGADSVVMDVLIRRAFGKPLTEGWAYMAGHVVNLYLIPAMFAMAIRRIQIFSAKYRSLGLSGSTEPEMARQNMRAMMALRTFVSSGSKVVVLYPEGGRGEGALKMGEPKTMAVPTIMNSASSQGLVILPTYVRDATNILPVVRGDNEFNEVFEHAQRGRASMTVGSPIRWDSLQPCEAEVLALASSLPGGANKENLTATRHKLTCEAIMRLIAELAPLEERGPYA